MFAFEELVSQEFQFIALTTSLHIFRMVIVREVLVLVLFFIVVVANIRTRRSCSCRLRESETCCRFQRGTVYDARAAFYRSPGY